jgi:hypothetical protein
MKKIEQIKDAEPTVVLNLQLCRIINKRQISNDNVDSEIDTKLLHVSVDLFDAPELRACQNYQAALKTRVKRYTTPSFFRGGMYKVKTAAIEKVDAILEAAVPEFEVLVRKFADVVDERREESKVRLKGGYDESLYPTKEHILRVYRIDWNWLEFGTPNTLKEINAKIFERERDKAAEQLRKATEGVTVLLAAEAKKLADHLVQRLTVSGNAAPKQLRQSAVGNIEKFLETFELRNVSDSEDLKKQIGRIRALVKGVDADKLRDDGMLRSSIVSSFVEVSAALDDMVVEKPRRFMQRDKKEGD